MKWFRFYHEAYRNPKVQQMRPELFKFWVNFLCVASESEPRGTVASEAHLKLALGLPKALVKRWVSELEALVLLDRSERGALTPHDWYSHQPDGDDEAKRKRRYRDKIYEKRQEELFRDKSDGPQEMSRDNFGTVRPSRARVLLEGDREGEGEENVPPPPSIVLGPEYTKVGEFAIQLMGDVSWGAWVDRQGLCGHSAKDIRAALEECAGAGKHSQAYVASKLRGWAAEGGRPKRKGENNGKTAVQQDPEETRTKLERPNLPRTPEFAGINKYWDDLEAGRPVNPKDLSR